MEGVKGKVVSLEEPRRFPLGPCRYHFSFKLCTLGILKNFSKSQVENQSKFNHANRQKIEKRILEISKIILSSKIQNIRKISQIMDVILKTGCFPLKIF